MATDSKPRVLLAEGSDPGPLAWLREQAEVIEIANNDPDFVNVLQTVHGLLVRTYTKVTAAFLDQAPLCSK